MRNMTTLNKTEWIDSIVHFNTAHKLSSLLTRGSHRIFLVMQDVLPTALALNFAMMLTQPTVYIKIQSSSYLSENNEFV